MTTTTLELTHEAHTLRITLNRPEVLNALSLTLLEELHAALAEAIKTPDVRAVLITGAGRGFCSGADLGNTGDLAQDIGAILERYYHPVVEAITTAPKPVIAAVNGVAAGAGLSLALACDMRLLSEAASFTAGFPRIGLVFDAAASHFLPRLVGRGRAFELAYSGRKLGASEALALGLGEQILPADGFAEAAFVFAKGVAAGPTRSFALIKQEFNGSEHNSLDEQLRLEAKLQAAAAATADAAEGMRAFAEKRAPHYKGE